MRSRKYSYQKSFGVPSHVNGKRQPATINVHSQVDKEGTKALKNSAIRVIYTVVFPDNVIITAAVANVLLK